MLRNLVDNALRHGSARLVEVGITRDNGEAVLVVSDDGKGIPATEHEAVQQRFRRGTGADSHGSGLGLSIVGRIAELHGGTLEMACGPSDHGLVVRLRLPLADSTG
jgi:signal transduction histidine kinase